MADRELLLVTKARDLLIYTRKVTKPVNSDVDARDVGNLLKQISCLEGMDKVRDVCRDTSTAMKRRSKRGFSKSSYRDFGQDMRDLTKNILRGVFEANNVMFTSEPEKRLAMIDNVLNDTALLLEYIHICQEADIVSTKTAGAWSEKAVEVKRMAAAWRKSCAQRADKVLESRKLESDQHMIALVRQALKTK